MSQTHAAVVVQGPTAVNPDRLSREELIEQLQRAQRDAFVLCSKLADMNQVAWRQAGLIDTLVDAHLAGDTDQLSQKLQLLADYRAAQIEPSRTAH